MKEKKLFLFVILISLFVLPHGVYALTDSEIQEKKEVTINSVPPTSVMEYYQIMEYFYETSGGYMIDDCNETYTTCTISKGSENPEIIATEVKINYEYDETVKKVVDDIMKNVPEDGISFTLNDIEMLYYLHDLVVFYHSSEDPDYEDEPSPFRYSNAYNEFMGYRNFIFEPRMGYDAMYKIFKAGTAAFKYEGTIYGFSDGISANVPVILFVADDEENVKEALQTRLSKYFPGIKVTEDSTGNPPHEFQEELDNVRQNYRDCKEAKEHLTELEALEASDPSAENQQNRQAAQQNYNNICSHFGYDETYDDEDGYMEDYEAMVRAEEWEYVDKMVEAVYTVTFPDEVEVYVGAAKDSSKVFNDDIKVTTSDTSSEVTISASSVIPLDTLIEVARVTSGEEYEKIVGVLKELVKTDSLEMFDLKLYSKSNNGYITTLEDGTFEVKLPLSDALKDKDNLVVYYVDENNKTEVHPAKPSEDKKFVTFTTDHFSIYTLAESTEEEKEETTNPTETASGTETQNDNAATQTEEKAEPTTANPKTGDGIISYVIMLVLSMFGLSGSTLYLKKRRFN